MTASGSPLQLVVMGVTGTGKSTIGELVASDLGVRLIEGDAYHPASNIAKMSAGQPLTDADRRPWLETLAGLLAAERAAGRTAVLACSALRRSHRDVLRGGTALGDVFFVHLRADPDLLARRMRDRTHFMPESLLQSQLDALEPLEPDEAGMVVDVELPVDQVLAQVRTAFAQWRAARS